MNSARHDELVEEIADKILAYYDGCPVIAREDREISRAIIALTLKAVVDGMWVHPWEIERFAVYGTNPEHIQNMWYRRIVKEGAYHIIALRPTGISVEGKEKCKVCGKVATHICSATGCSKPLCDDCSCAHYP